MTFPSFSHLFLPYPHRIFVPFSCNFQIYCLYLHRRKLAHSWAAGGLMYEKDVFRRLSLCVVNGNIIKVMKMTKDDALNALKKAIEHKKEAKTKFEQWLQEKGIEGKVVTV